MFLLYPYDLIVRFLKSDSALALHAFHAAARIQSCIEWMFGARANGIFFVLLGNKRIVMHDANVNAQHADDLQ